MTDADNHIPTAAQAAIVRCACMAKQRLDPSCRYPECSCHGMLAVHTAAPELLAALNTWLLLAALALAGWRMMWV